MGFRQNLGKKGEETAVCLLKDNGYKILLRNYKTKLGEIDIIAKDKDVFCFVEVKSRSSLSYGLPLEAVSLKKQRQISKSALIFLKENNFLDKKARFDVVSIFSSGTFSECRQAAQSKSELIKNAFELEDRYVI
ncbi:MAG: YraN family protein [Candidatus Omnitrophota bacterium]|nr:YraN family protein [Candidatus Omnitrophota bacterium]